MDEMQAEMQLENDELKKGIALKDKEIEARTKENAEEIEFMNNKLAAQKYEYETQISEKDNQLEALKKKISLLEQASQGPPSLPPG